MKTTQNENSSSYFAFRLLIVIRYPFLACEILASEVWAICDAMYQNPNLLDDLYSYFEKDPPLNPLLSSYTSRVAAILLSKKVAEVSDSSQFLSSWNMRFSSHLYYLHVLRTC